MVKMKLAWTMFLGGLGVAVAAFAAEPEMAARPAFSAEQLVRQGEVGYLGKTASQQPGIANATVRLSGWQSLQSNHLLSKPNINSFRMTGPGNFFLPVTGTLPTESLSLAALLPQEEDEKLPGRSTVFFKSLLLPGWGQHSLGAKTSARSFLIAEAVLWGVVIGSQMHGTNLAEDYKAMAAGQASVRGTDKDSRYWVDVGNFDSIFDYNQAKLQQRSIADLRDPQGEDYWFWDATANRTTYENLRVRSDAAYERRDFAVAAVITNHIISAIHAMWMHRKRTSPKEEAAPNKDIGMNMLPDGRGGEVSFSVRF